MVPASPEAASASGKSSPVVSTAAGAPFGQPARLARTAVSERLAPAMISTAWGGKFIPARSIRDRVAALRFCEGGSLGSSSGWPSPGAGGST